MIQIRSLSLFIPVFLLLHTVKSEFNTSKQGLIHFLDNLSSNGVPDPRFGWNIRTDPCWDSWQGIVCDHRNVSVTNITLDNMNLVGVLDISSLCEVQPLASNLLVLNLNNNNISGQILDKLSECSQLTEFHVSGNNFSGRLPASLSTMNNLQILEISNNKLSGPLPDIARIKSLQVFLAQNNQLSGSIPKFDFANFLSFDVSFNNFAGRISNNSFPESSFTDNPGLCGNPLPNECPSESSTEKVLMYSGYAVIGLAIGFFIICRVSRKKKATEGAVEGRKKIAAIDDDDDSQSKSSPTSSDYKTGISKSDLSLVSADQSAMVSTSLVVLKSPAANRLNFDELLKAPAELLGRGKHGSVYKVICDDGAILAVKRVKDWSMSNDTFKLRMQRIDQVMHPNVLPPVAFYCSKQEKLLVYEYQPNGNLLGLLHGTQTGQIFDWVSRLGVAASIAEALAFMHRELKPYGIAHGNLKSSNILFNKHMDPCISEYGLVLAENEDLSFTSSNNHDLIISTEETRVSGSGQWSSSFKVDIYALGVILLELLTGKLVQQNGLDLATWVHSVVREEWTVEVFDKALISEGASEERMVNLLQVAVRCVNRSPEARPSITQVATMINSIKEEDERSIVSEA